VSGDPDSVHTAGISCRGRISASEADVPDEELQDHIVNWPNRIPKAARFPKAKVKKKVGAK
jgi:uncharacterized cysteine cluster protein YcgN (CxxCxxCC family)